MFTVPFEHIVSPSALRDAAMAIRSKSLGIDKESLRRYRDDPEAIARLSDELRSGRYVPQPLERLELPKADGETRPIALASVRDKIVQKALQLALEPYFDKNFSDKNYGYRPGKGPLRAINRVRDFIARGYRYVYKTDIDDFFETIPHQKLLAVLKREIADGRIVTLIELYLKNGVFSRKTYETHLEGVHQGDVLSPLLSNIYLDAMDKRLETYGTAFVRFADDFVLLFRDNTTVASMVTKLRAFLQTLGLKLGEDKSYEASVEEGFTFLGCRFSGKTVRIDNDRLQKKVSKLYALTKKALPLEAYVDELNTAVEGMQRYYLAILTPQDPQYTHLEHALTDSAVRRFAAAFERKEIRYKKEALPLAERLLPLRSLPLTERKRFAKTIVDKAKLLAKSKGDTRQTAAALHRQKQRYAKAMATSSTIIADEYGTVLGVSKKMLVLKQKGKVKHRIPLKQCERIIVQTKGASLSSELIRRCAKEGISVDFIDETWQPYATLYTRTHAYASRITAQLEAYHDTAYRLRLAKGFVKAKLKNQRNYLKYLDKHHRQLAPYIARIAVMAGKVASAENIETLRGIEGSASVSYWDGLRTVLEDKTAFETRITQGAVDPFNSALNYGYAILYGEIQRALVQAGLALHISFLHALDGAKPTLVFDAIEPFRTFTVDRTVVSMFNRKEPIKTDKEGKLTKDSRRLIAKNVIERLGSFTKHDGASKRLRTVIEQEAYALAHAIDAHKPYRPFIGRY